MFWNDSELTKKRGARIHLAPPIPDTGWIKPINPPNLDSAVVLSFDTETKDLTLNDEGPGWARGKAHVVGVSIGAQDRQGNRGAWYFPIRHEVEPGDNLDPAHVLPWLSTILDTPRIPKVGANLTYDIGNLADEGVKVSGPLDDCQFAEALIDNEALVALDVLGYKYLGVGKQTSALREWCKAAYPDTPDTFWRSDIHRAPPKLVGPYAISDATLPLDVFNQQYPILYKEELLQVYRLECDLIPLMIKMRLEGISVDVRKAEEMIVELNADIRELYGKIYHETGFNLQSTSPANLKALFDYVGIKYLYTAAGNPSFTKEWLASLEYPIAQIIIDIREHEKMISTFLQGYIINKNINGKLHPQLHQLANDENGTKVGRFSSSDPNLQNIPARSKLGKRVRACFVHDTGHHRWLKFDQSQVHYRILAHFATGPGSDELRQAYNDNAAIDYHRNVYNNVAPLRNWSLTDEEEIEDHRRIIKNINFSGLYGVGLGTIKHKYLIGMADDEVKKFMEDYYAAAPYIKPTTKAIGMEVQMFGYVKTLLGRRIRFHLFEPAGRREKGEYFEPLPYEQALRAYGAPLKRAYEYRGVNYKFQGSEPDIIKSGMLDCYNSGVFDYLGVPRVTVHDEIDFSIRDDTAKTREALEFVRFTMTHSIKLRVPLKVDEEAGPSWGTVKKIKAA